ncbi:NADPH-dependent ferric-chelate reductase [Bdellovibrio bacteriovorus]|uniref:siderophore-interacting protein n=1 Tax=Bdellovibrio bacteriovorus TaxID=959 RepID=UPI00045BF5EE|nr:siderophore-interacting protein [Bdellovibrio bacteriovorus]AHZ83726.1 FAD-binding protein [Bdellovibrio bacteriovorus]BEV69699.1 NADPH-dependent ferric-chelate reductase [Bdellovibrio bacteriovorus]
MENTYRQPQSVRHNLKFRLLQVKSITDLSPRMRRITLTGEDLADFYSASPDDHVKVFFPKPGEKMPVVPELGPQGPVFPEGEKPIMRDYTPRRYDNATKELDLEFFLHEKGPAADWARTAQIGSYLGVGGPRGSTVVPYDFDWYLLIGDECAIPSFARRLSELPANAEAVVVVEIGSESEKRDFESQARVTTHWVLRENHPPGTAAKLKESVLKALLPHGDYFCWIATELQTSKELKELVETVRGANPDWVKATGYWKKHETT